MVSRFSPLRAVCACLVLVLILSIAAPASAAAGPGLESTILQTEGPTGDGNGTDGGDGAGIPMPGEQENESTNESTSDGGDADADADAGGGNDTRIPLPDEQEQENETAGDGNETNATGADDQRGGGTTGGGVIGGFGPSPTEWAVDLLTGLFNILLGELEYAVDLFHEWGVGIPAPGVPTDMSSWSDRSQMSAMWRGAVAGHFTSAAIGLLWLMTQALEASTKGPMERRQQYKRIGIAAVLILGGYHFFAPFPFHLFNEFAMEISPDGADFTGSFGNMARLGLGLFFGAIVVLISAGTFAIGLLSIVVVDALTYSTYALWGLIWAAWASDGQARGYGFQGIFTIGAICALALVQAVILDVIFNIPWDGTAGPIDALLGTAFGLGIAYIYLPWTFLKQTVYAAATAIGTSAALAGSKIDAAIENRIFEREEQYKEEAAYDSGGQPSGSSSGSPSSPDGGGGGGAMADPGAGGSSHEQPADQVDGMYEDEVDRIDYHYN